MIYLALWASLSKFCNDQALAMKAAGIADPVFVNLDAHANMSKLPDADIIGVRGLSYEVDKTVAVTCMFGVVSRTDDINLFRHNRMVDFLATVLEPDKSIPLVDPDTGADIGWLEIKAGTGVLPVINTDTRPFQLIAVTLGTCLTAGA